MISLLKLPPDYGAHSQKFTDIFQLEYWEWVWGELVQQTSDQVEFITNINRIAHYLNNPEDAAFTFMKYCVEHKEFMATTAAIGGFLFVCGSKKLGAKIGWGSVIVYAVLCVLATEFMK